MRSVKARSFHPERNYSFSRTIRGQLAHIRNGIPWRGWLDRNRQYIPYAHTNPHRWHSANTQLKPETLVPVGSTGRKTPGSWGVLETTPTDGFWCTHRSSSAQISAGWCPTGKLLFTPHRWIGDGNCCFVVALHLRLCCYCRRQRNRGLWDLFATYLHSLLFCAVFLPPFYLFNSWFAFEYRRIQYKILNEI